MTSDEYKESLIVLLDKKKKQVKFENRADNPNPKRSRTGYRIYIQEGLAKG